MAKTDDLFELIHSLSMQEKRHFKLFAGRYSGKKESNYIRLFNAISAQKKYDEQKLKMKFGTETFIKHLAFEKHHLHVLITRSLRQYHSGHSVDMQLKELLLDAEILHERSLYAHCRKVLNKADKMARRYERFVFIPEIVRLRSRLYDLENLDSVYKEESEALQKIQTINKYRSLSNKVAIMVASTHSVRKKKDILWFDRLMKDPLLKDEKEADSFTAKVYFFYIKGVYFEMKGDLISGYDSRKRFVELMETNSEQLEVHTKNYLSALNNLAISQLDLQKFSEAMQTVDKLRNMSSITKSAQPEDIRVSSFIFSTIIELNVYIRTGDFNTGYQRLAAVENGLKKFEGKILKQFEIVINNSVKYICFGVGDLRRALQWSNRIINETDPTIRQDIQSMTRIFNLILHYELGNTELLEYILRSTYRFLLKGERLYKVENIVLNYLRRSTHLTTKKEIIDSFKQLHNELISLVKDRYEKKAFEEFDIISWLESKITGRSFAEVIRYKNPGTP